MTLASTVIKQAATPLTYGVQVVVFPADPTLSIEIWRAPDSAGSPNDAAKVQVITLPPQPISGGRYFDHLPNDGATYYYKSRHVGPGYQPSAFTAYTGGVTGVLAGDVGNKNSFVAIGAKNLRRDLALSDGSFALQSTDASGTIAPSPAVQTDGAAGRTLAKGVLVGTAQHAAAVTYPLAYQNTPEVKFQGGISYEPRNAQWSGGAANTGTVPQYDDFAALSSTASGFTVQARLRQKGAPTARVAEFGGGNAITTVGGTVTSAALASAPSNTSNYTVSYYVHLTPLFNNKGQQITLTLAVDARVSNVAGYTQYATINYSYTPTQGVTTTQSWPSESQTIAVGAVTATGDIRLRVVSWSGPLDTFSVHGFVGSPTDPTDGVSYTTSTDSFASKTPDTADSVTWWAKAIT